MEYFDINNVPQNFLRATFVTRSAVATDQLMSSSGVLIEAGMENATAEHKLRVGYQGLYGSGKSPSAQASARAIPSLTSYTKLLNGWSNIYTTDQEQTLLHYDIEALNTSGIATADDISMRARREWESHKKNCATSIAHKVEWPEKDRQRPNYSALWKFSVLGSSENHRQISLITTEQIAAMSQLQKFLEDAAHFRVA